MMNVTDSGTGVRDESCSKESQLLSLADLGPKDSQEHRYRGLYLVLLNVQTGVPALRPDLTSSRRMPK
jgi:hypothetical protein